MLVSYIGETGRKFGTRLKEHKTEVEYITSKPFTRNQRASSLSEQNKLECGPMPNLMVALLNIGGALCSTPQSLADAHY